jgi:hypothetical protein
MPSTGAEYHARRAHAAAAAAAAIDAWLSVAPSEAARRDAQALAECIRSGLWNPQLLPVMLSVGRALAGVNLGDLLTAIGGLAAAGEAEWIFEPAVDADAFDALGYASASAGISRTQRENRQGWWRHASHNRAFILNAATQVKRRRVAVVLGAGKAYDLPLVELAERFERVVLVDIDAASLASTSAAVVRDADLRRKVELRSMDLTGVTACLARGVENAIATATDAASAETALEALCSSYRLSSPPSLMAPGERADLMVSSLVLSQLGLQQKLMAKKLFEGRFGAITRQSDLRWSCTWGGLELRLQQDHINALADHAEIAVLTSDTVHHATVLGDAGAERLRGESWSVIGSETLEERVPGFVEIVARAGWSWPRIGARPGGREGVRTDVGGVVLRLRETPFS